MNWGVRLQKFGVIIAYCLPVKLGDFIATILGLLSYYILVRRRSIIKKNLSHIFYNQKLNNRDLKHYCRRTFINYARIMHDFLRLRFIKREFLLDSVQPRGLENLHQALNLGRGCVLLTFHLGSWDYAGSYLAAQGFQMNALVEETSPEMFEFYNRHRSRFGLKPCPLSRAGYAFLNIIKNNQVLAVLADRDIVGDGIKVKLFSGFWRLPRGLGSIVVRRNIPVALGYMVFNSTGRKRYLSVIMSPRTFSDERSFYDWLIENLETLVRKYPDQWFVFQPEWC